MWGFGGVWGFRFQGSLGFWGIRVWTAQSAGFEGFDWVFKALRQESGPRNIRSRPVGGLGFRVSGFLGS